MRAASEVLELLAPLRRVAHDRLVVSVVNREGEGGAWGRHARKQTLVFPAMLHDALRTQRAGRYIEGSAKQLRKRSGD